LATKLEREKDKKADAAGEQDTPSKVWESVGFKRNDRTAWSTRKHCRLAYAIPKTCGFCGDPFKDEGLCQSVAQVHAARKHWWLCAYCSVKWLGEPGREPWGVCAVFGRRRKWKQTIQYVRGLRLEGHKSGAKTLAPFPTTGQLRCLLDTCMGARWGSVTHLDEELSSALPSQFLKELFEELAIQLEQRKWVVSEQQLLTDGKCYVRRWLMEKAPPRHDLFAWAKECSLALATWEKAVNKAMMYRRMCRNVDELDPELQEEWESVGLAEISESEDEGSEESEAEDNKEEEEEEA
jgi:hypothetical protein